MSRVWIMGYCARCGKPFVVVGQREARYCSETHRKHDAVARRRARRMGVESEPYYRVHVFERDGWRCQVCGEPVPRHANNRDPSVATIDHVIPMSRGGADAPANLQTSHRMCNAKRNESEQQTAP